MIRHEPIFDITLVEDHYSEKDNTPVRYVCTSALGGEEYAGDIFYRSTPHPEFGNKYFRLFRHPFTKELLIQGADCIEEVEFGMAVEDNDLVYSQHRHHCTSCAEGFIDGGRAYVRTVGPVEVEMYKVKDGEFEQV